MPSVLSATRSSTAATWRSASTSVKSNAAAKKEAKAKGEVVVLKRLPAQPREARTVSTKNNTPQTLAALPYETTI